MSVLTARRLVAGDVACWVLKTSVPPRELAPGWSANQERTLRRCVRRSYRLRLMAPGQPCLLWLSGRVDPGVHAVGVLTAAPDDEPAVEVRLHLLDRPVARAELARSDFATAEVMRMPAGSNPSYLTQAQLRPVVAAVHEQLDKATRQAAGWTTQGLSTSLSIW